MLKIDRGYVFQSLLPHSPPLPTFVMGNPKFVIPDVFYRESILGFSSDGFLPVRSVHRQAG